MITISNINKSFGEIKAVDNITLTIDEKQVFGLIGTNGAGKSTLMKIIMGIYRADGGEISMDGKPVNMTNPSAALAAGVYMVPQEPMLFPNMTVEENILMGFHESPIELKKRLAKHMEELGFKLNLQRKANTLSIAEQQLVEILRGMMREAKVLILDEPPNDLDIVPLNILEEYLLEFKGSLIIVTHDRHFLDRLADHLFVFCGDGVIKDFVGGYSAYRTFITDLRKEQKARSAAAAAPAPQKPKPAVPRKLSWKEKKEMEQLEAELEALGAEQKELEALLAGGTDDYQKITAASARYEQLRAIIDAKETRWLELSEI